MKALSLSKKNLYSGIDLLGGLGHLFLQQAADSAETLEIQDLSMRLIHNNVEILESTKDLSTTLMRDLSEGPRLLIPRISNPSEHIHRSPAECIESSLDSVTSHICAGLRLQVARLSQEKAPRHWVDTVIILGAPLLSVLSLDLLSDSVKRIIVLESNPRDLAIALSLVNLSTLVEEAKLARVGLQIIFESDAECLKAKIREELVAKQPTALFGMLLLRSPIENLQLNLIQSWMRSEDGLLQAVVGGLGSETDELNQVLQGIVTACQRPVRQLVAPQLHRKDKPAVIVASGPSLEDALPWLRDHQESLQIVASGSSLGVLVRNHIKPACAVFLERSSTVYENDILELKEEGHDLSSIPLIGSMTLDPRIHQLFDPVAFFHRPLSATLTLFPDEAGSKLLQSGPQSANAALEALLHLGHRRFLLIGCDFGAATRSHPRARQALGTSPRQLDLPLMGRHGRTVFSSPELSDAASYFANALCAYSAEVSSVAAGVVLEGVNLDLVSLDENTSKLFANSEPLVSGWNMLPVANVSSEELRDRLDCGLDAYYDLNIQIKDSILLSKEWDLQLARKMDYLLGLDETGLSPAQALVKRLCRFPLLFTLQPLHDAEKEDWPHLVETTFANLDWLASVYGHYFRFLMHLIEHLNREPCEVYCADYVKSLLRVMK